MNGELHQTIAVDGCSMMCLVSPIAQLGEYYADNIGVVGSSPTRRFALCSHIAGVQTSICNC